MWKGIHFKKLSLRHFHIDPNCYNYLRVSFRLEICHFFLFLDLIGSIICKFSFLQSLLADKYINQSNFKLNEVVIVNICITLSGKPFGY